MTDLKEKELDFNLVYDWILDDWFRESDFILTEWNYLPTLYNQDDEIYEYNQSANSWSKKSCTLYSAIWAVSDLMNYEFSLSEIKQINDISYTLGRKQNDWWYVYKAVDLVRKRWNDNKRLVKDYGKVAYYRVDLANDDLVDTIISKGYTLCSWYNGNNEYNIDYYQDWVLNKDKFSYIWYRHAVSWRKVNGKRCIKDNYKGSKYNWEDRNIYEVEPKCSTLVANNVFFPNAYLFTKVKEDNYEELIRLNKMRTLLNTACDCHSQLRHLTNDTQYKNRLHTINEKHREKLRDVDMQEILHS